MTISWVFDVAGKSVQLNQNCKFYTIFNFWECLIFLTETLVIRTNCNRTCFSLKKRKNWKKILTFNYGYWNGPEIRVQNEFSKSSTLLFLHSDSLSIVFHWKSKKNDLSNQSQNTKPLLLNDLPAWITWVIGIRISYLVMIGIRYCNSYGSRYSAQFPIDPKLLYN